MKSLDPTLRLIWPAIPFVALGLVAYFQAAGIVSLVAAQVGTPALQAALPPAERPPPLPVPSATPILRRNPFDSDTGPLGRFAPEPLPEPTASATAVQDPMSVAKCDFAYVTLISASDDPAWSFAAIELKGGESKLRRVGSAIDGHTVRYVSWDRVWLSQGSDLCQLQIGDKPEVKKRKPRRTKKKRRRKRRPRGARLPKHIASKITKVGATEYAVERSAIDEILQEQATLFRATRVRPVREGGETTGMKVSRVRGGSLLHTIGVRNGDVVQGINGFSLTDPQKALEAYGRLRTADHLALSLVRKGKPVTIDIAIN